MNLPPGYAPILALYALALPPWAALSLWAARRSAAWAYTPRWHGRAVPAFRTFFLLTMPLEYGLAERPFIPAVFGIAAAATLAWLVGRGIYLYRAPRELPRGDAVAYNLAYIANLIAFATATHSFVCLAVLLNIGVPLLVVRERAARNGH